MSLRNTKNSRLPESPDSGFRTMLECNIDEVKLHHAMQNKNQINWLYLTVYVVYLQHLLFAYDDDY